MTTRQVTLLLLAAIAIAPFDDADAAAPRKRDRQRASDREVPASLEPGIAPAVPAAPLTDIQQRVFAARDAVLPALVHVEPILELYRLGRKEKAAITGSGVIVSAEGYVLTNNHVVENAQRVTCVLYDKRELTARVVGRDAFTDVAVLQLDAKGESLPVAELGQSADLSAGQYVIAMGSPLGLARSISVGVVSTPDRYLPEDVLPTGEITGTYNTWIQTDAAINPGNSGGPLVDLAGRVVGINARAVPIFGENIGFAIPIDVVKDVASQLIEDGAVERSWIGVKWQHLKSLADYFGTDERGGVLVGGVVTGGTAQQAGIQAGDVLLSWDGQPVSIRFEEELPRFNKLVADTPIGREVPVVLLRDGREVRVRVRTAARPGTDSEEIELDAWGLTAKDLTPELARQRRMKDVEGALITGVKPAAPAAVAGLRDDDVIREIEGHRIRDTDGLLEVYRDLRSAGRRQVLVKASRGATVRVAVIELRPEGS